MVKKPDQCRFCETKLRRSARYCDFCGRQTASTEHTGGKPRHGRMWIVWTGCLLAAALLAGGTGYLAYQEGMKQGVTAGKSANQRSIYNKGYDEGYKTGWSKGSTQAFEDGYNQGRRQKGPITATDYLWGYKADWERQ